MSDRSFVKEAVGKVSACLFFFKRTTGKGYFCCFLLIETAGKGFAGCSFLWEPVGKGFVHTCAGAGGELNPIAEFEAQLFPLSFFCILFARVGDRKADQTDRVRFIFDLFQQGFGQREDFGECRQLVVLSGASCLLVEVVELDLECKGVSFEAGPLQAFDQFGCNVIEFDDDGGLAGDVFFERMFAAYGLADADGFDWAQVYSP